MRDLESTIRAVVEECAERAAEIARDFIDHAAVSDFDGQRDAGLESAAARKVEDSLRSPSFLARVLASAQPGTQGRADKTAPIANPDVPFESEDDDPYEHMPALRNIARRAYREQGQAQQGRWPVNVWIDGEWLNASGPRRDDIHDAMLDTFGIVGNAKDACTVYLDDDAEEGRALLVAALRERGFDVTESAPAPHPGTDSNRSEP